MQLVQLSSCSKAYFNYAKGCLRSISHDYTAKVISPLTSANLLLPDNATERNVRLSANSNFPNDGELNHWPRRPPTAFIRLSALPRTVSNFATSFEFDVICIVVAIRLWVVISFLDFPGLLASLHVSERHWMKPLNQEPDWTMYDLLRSYLNSELAEPHTVQPRD